MTQWHHRLFDRIVAQHIATAQPTVCMAFASFALHTMRRAKSIGAVTVVERASAHARTRQTLLDEEYRRFGLERMFDPFLRECADHEELEYAEADFVSVPSRFAAASFLSNGISPNKIIRNPFGVDLNKFKPTTSAHVLFRVLSVGHLGLEKGTPDLLEALRLLNDPTAELCTVGGCDPRLEPLLRRFSAGVRWKRVPPMSQTELANMYPACSVYCLLSVQEGLSLTILEALASGLPVVASENTGAGDILTNGHDGFVIPIRRPDLAAEHLAALRLNPQMRMEMGANARRTAERLGWNVYGDRVFSSLAHAAASTHRGDPERPR